MKRAGLIIAGFILLMQAANSQPKANDIQFVKDDNHINTVAQLLARFKGKPVFMDLWAPWCEPCKEEFKFADELHRQLNQRGIQMLYVSVNTQVTDSAWHADISRFKLQGYHIKAGNALQDALSTLIWGAPGGFSIPRYVLFNAQGKAVLMNALPPSSGMKLYEQLNAVLKPL